MPIARSLCLAATLILASVVDAADGSGLTKGEIQLPGGPRVVYDYQFDRNAFAAGVDAPGGLIALTRSGNLLRFDPTTFKLDREWFGPSRATCLNAGPAGSVLVGFEDGRVARVDPANLTQTAVADGLGKIQWVGTRREGGIVAVVERRQWVDPEDERIERDKLLGEMGVGVRVLGDNADLLPALAWEPFSEVRDLTSGQSIPVFKLASTFAIDREDRVWLGSKENAYGGWVRCVDLVAGKPHPIRGKWKPSERFQGRDGSTNWGFHETRDGQIWGYGGSIHETSTADINRLDGSRVEDLYECEAADGFGDATKKRQRPDRPNNAIERITEGLEPDSLLVFAEDGESAGMTIFRTNMKLNQWSKWLTLDVRPWLDFRDPADLMPVVREVHRRPATGDLILATERDGYLRINDGRQTRNLAPGQLEAKPITTIIGTPQGIFLQERSLDFPWRYRDGSWSQIPLDQTNEEERDQYRIMAGPGGTTDVVCAGFTARQWGGKVKSTPERPPGEATQTFTTPEGSLWHISPSERENPGGIARFDGTNWEYSGRLLGAMFDEERVDWLENGEWHVKSLSFGYETWGKKRTDGKPCVMPDTKEWNLSNDLRVVSDTGPPWVVHDRDMGRLMIFTHAPDHTGASLAPLAVMEGDLPLSVDDAIAWTRDEILIATRTGLHLCAIATGKIRPSPLPATGFPVRRLARDGLGRIWLGGDGLGMIDAKGRFQNLAEVPMVGRSAVAALVANPTQREGVVVSFGVRGIVFLQVDPAS